ncbi:MAG: methyltransferase domain-containing protein [Acidobacteriota bacterium]|nr:methyltransferase domain-containing protein [Acidobacteriota bacterium]
MKIRIWRREQWLLRALVLCLMIVPVMAYGQDSAPMETASAEADVQKWVEIFEDPERWNWQGGIHILGLMAIEYGDTVADIGAGTGYFVRYLAPAVGDDGTVYAVDINPAFLDHITSRIDYPNSDRVFPILAAPDDPQLPAGEIDAALILNTWHHIDNRVAYAEKLKESMSRSGRVVVVDWRAESLPLGPPIEEKVSRETVIQEFEKAGWRLVTDSTILQYQYLLSFYPDRS